MTRKTNLVCQPRVKLAAARRQVGLTQRTLATLCGIKVETVRMYEQGRMGNGSALSNNRLLGMIEQIERRAGETRQVLDLRPHVLCPEDFAAPVV